MNRDRYQITFIDKVTNVKRMEMVSGYDLIEMAERFYSIHPRGTKIISIKNLGKGY